MNKILHVAWRDFCATVLTKAFIIGAFVVPVVVTVVMVIGFGFLLTDEAPRIEGSVAVIDLSRVVSAGIAERLRPEAIAEREREELAEATEALRDKTGLASGPVDRALESGGSLLGEAPQLSLEVLAADADLEQEKAPLREGKRGDGGRLVLAVIDADAVAKSAGGKPYGGFQLFVRGNLDERIESIIDDAVRDAIREQRIRAQGFEPRTLNELTRVRSQPITEVTEEGERASTSMLRMFIPVGFMAILMVSVMIGAQYLLMTTVEEKSSRVVEVLLSGLSPMQLMTGKILGQLGAGLSILVTYGSLGGGALILKGSADLLGLANVIYLVVFFLITYMMIGAMMAAVGSAVNDIREAQSLQTPVIMTLMIPYLLWLPISRDPGSVFATICSFLPPVNGFVMIIRVTSTEPPPTWQVLLSIAVGLVGVYISLWAAAKIFRIGLLMFGKPPNFRTLIKWVRMA